MLNEATSGAAPDHFEKQHPLGEALEVHVAALLIMQGIHCRKPANVREAWDVEAGFSGRWQRLECKYDLMADATGNMYFQTHFYHRVEGWKEWGVFKPGPDWWVQAITFCNVLCFPVEELRLFLRDSIAEGRARVLQGGKYKHTKGVLISLEELEQCPGIRHWGYKPPQQMRQAA